MAVEEVKNPMEWPKEANEASDFDFMMVGKDGNPIMKIKKQKLNEIIVVQGESMPAIQGGTTPATAVALPAGPTGQNRWFDASWGYWKYNNVVLKNPNDIDGIPQGWEGKVYWNGTSLSWSIPMVQKLLIQEGVSVLTPTGTDLPQEKAVANYISDKTVNDISTGGTTKLLSAEQGKVIAARLPIPNEINDMLQFVDNGGKMYAKFDVDGKMTVVLSDAVKDDLKELKEFQNTDVFQVIEEGKRVVAWVDKDGFFNAKIKDINPNKTAAGLSMLTRYPYDSEKGKLAIDTINLIGSCTINTVAVGRSSTSTFDDAKRITLGVKGNAGHPSVKYYPQGWQGKKYWMAFTPYFGEIMLEPNPAAFENAHIMCSDDGIIWDEPVDKFGNKVVNPLDRPVPQDWVDAHAGSLGYWSDTHIELGDDGYMYCFYRGNYQPFPVTELNNPVEIAYNQVRRSKDGVHWEAPKLIMKTSTVAGTINEYNLDKLSGIVSPAIVNNNGTWNYWDIAANTTALSYPADIAQTGKFVFRLNGTSADGTYKVRNQYDICSFDSRPWGSGNEPWHIDVIKHGNVYFMLICAGTNNASNGDYLYLAYSGDGSNWKVIPDTLFSGTYRSAVVVKDVKGDNIILWIYRGRKDNGKLEIHEVKLKYQ